jgi:hypothetical protein
VAMGCDRLGSQSCLPCICSLSAHAYYASYQDSSEEGDERMMFDMDDP